MSLNDSDQPREINERETVLFGFLEEVFQLDQSTPGRTNAETCLKMLKERESEFIGTAIEDAYWNAVSLELFHLGQTAARDENEAKAKDYFVEAKKAAEKAISDAWLAYVEGTIHYLDNNKKGIEDVLSRVEGNEPVLKRFIAGLEARGFPCYKKDY